MIYKNILRKICFCFIFFFQITNSSTTYNQAYSQITTKYMSDVPRFIDTLIERYQNGTPSNKNPDFQKIGTHFCDGVCNKDGCTVNQMANECLNTDHFNCTDQHCSKDCPKAQLFISLIDYYNQIFPKLKNNQDNMKSQDTSYIKRREDPYIINNKLRPSSNQIQHSRVLNQGENSDNNSIKVIINGTIKSHLNVILNKIKPLSLFTYIYDMVSKNSNNESNKSNYIAAEMLMRFFSSQETEELQKDEIIHFRLDDYKQICEAISNIKKQLMQQKAPKLDLKDFTSGSEITTLVQNFKFYSSNQDIDNKNTTQIFEEIASFNIKFKNYIGISGKNFIDEQLNYDTLYQCIKTIIPSGQFIIDDITIILNYTSIALNPKEKDWKRRFKKKYNKIMPDLINEFIRVIELFLVINEFREKYLSDTMIANLSKSKHTQFCSNIITSSTYMQVKYKDFFEYSAACDLIIMFSISGKIPIIDMPLIQSLIISNDESGEGYKHKIMLAYLDKKPFKKDLCINGLGNTYEKSENFCNNICIAVSKFFTTPIYFCITSPCQIIYTLISNKPKENGNSYKNYKDDDY